MCVCVYIYIYTYICIYIYMYIHIYTYIMPQTHTVPGFRLGPDLPRHLTRGGM